MLFVGIQLIIGVLCVHMGGGGGERLGCISFCRVYGYLYNYIKPQNIIEKKSMVLNDEKVIRMLSLLDEHLFIFNSTDV